MHDPSANDVEAFRQYLKPRVFKILRALGLDVLYTRGLGDYLYYRDESGEEIQVLDLVGGFGASLFGHNHPELVQAARRTLEAQRPIQAQASIRGTAGRFARRLSEAVGKITGQSFVCTLANTGTEAVEAALKHAELERIRRLEAIAERTHRQIKQLRVRLRSQTARLSERFLTEAREWFDTSDDCPLDVVLNRIVDQGYELAERPPVFLAVEEAFHGKTLGSLSLTYNREFRHPWRQAGLRARFVSGDDPGGVLREVDRARDHYVTVEIAKDGTAELVQRSACHVAACLVEPIQGEGGIREHPPELLRQLRQAAEAEGFPLVIDEIQSGMGRTGAMLASSQLGLTGDYYLLAKSLGGGISKLSATLIDARRYIEDFGFLHTSTFAEDDYSSSVGLAVLDLIERDERAVIRSCQEKGEYLLGRLRELLVRYRDELTAVRGRGLMIGVELAAQDQSRSRLIRALSEQDLLGYAVCGLLLREHQIRVLPTLSAPRTIRLEPSAYVSQGAIDQFCDAFERTLRTIRDADSARLVQYVSGNALRLQVPSREEDLTIPVASSASALITLPHRKVAVIGHFLQPGDLRHWDPTLAPLSEEQCQRLLDRTADLLEPFVVHEAVVQSTCDAVQVVVLGLPFTSSQVWESYREGTHDWAVQLIEQAVEVAKRMGCSVAGFAGYTSIITNNCQMLAEDQLALTSGNSLTAAAALAALESALRRLDIQTRRLGIVGAAGNIGSVLAEVSADHVDQILLVGRGGARRRLNEVAAKLYSQAWQSLSRGEAASGVAATLQTTHTVRRIGTESTEDPSAVGERIRCGLEEELADRAPIRLADDMSMLRGCNAIISATNSPRPVITSEHVGSAPVVICDVAAPGDVDPALRQQRPDVDLIRGGIVRLPFGQTLNVPGMPLDRGQIYACLAETILLGLAGISHHFSYGPLEAKRVRKVIDLATAHGFTIEEGHEDFKSWSA